jgi:dihydrodipicolinate synthase/N-acetylneuraminate lyase
MDAKLSLIQGVCVAAVTPRRADSHTVDLAAALDLTDFLSQSGVNAISLLGSTGEFLHFDLEDRVRLVQFAVKRSRLPIIVNISHSLLDGALMLGRQAIQEGATGVLLMPPYFFRYSQSEIKEFYMRMAAGLSNGVPIILYNVPSFGNEVACETAMDLLSTGLFAGIKDSSGRLDYFLNIKAHHDRTRFTFLVGNDRIFTQCRMEGADGVVSGVACAVPALVLGRERAILAGRADLRDRLEASLQEFISWIELFPTPIGIKEAVATRGLTTSRHAVPLSQQTTKRLAEFREWFQVWFPVVQKEATGA